MPDIPTENEIREATNDQLDRWAAEGLTGWEWFRIERHRVAPHGYVWERAMREPDDPVYGNLERAHGDEPVFAGYGRCPPTCSTDIEAAMGLLRGFVDWGIDADGTAGRVAIVNESARHEYDDFEAGFNPEQIETLPRAITIACLLAWRASQ